MKTKMTKKEAQDMFYNSLCNGIGELRGYDLELVYDSKQYKESKSKLNSPCYEDVLMQILKDGGKLGLEDLEECEETVWITIEDLYKRAPNVPIKHLTDYLLGNDDATTADVILQTIFLNDVIYG
jgi:hypothetical protein